MKLLIVDDSKAMQAIVRRGLTKFEHVTFSIKKASNGKDALAVIDEWHPDIILSDWHMPHMSGLELLAVIRKRELPIKVGLVTTERNEGRIKKAIKLGAEFVLAKPFDDESLHKAIIPLIKVKANNGFVLPKLNRLQQTLNRSLSVEVTLTSGAPQQVSSELLPCIVGLFEDGLTNKIRSIAVLNLQAACILGGIKSELAKGEIDKMLAEKRISKEALEGGKKALSDCAAAFTIPGSKRNLTFKNMILLADDLQKVEALFNKPDEQRLDLSCQSADLQSGSITIIAS
ncbi:response regulator [Psychromonas aquimarina]|uniref:response regulator n=1 Tax=Psychromonas aquimarina TaxID=444919 RepID=UPI0003F9DC14|nr:response regulator [Psychromonas aquimarina]